MKQNDENRCFSSQNYVFCALACHSIHSNDAIVIDTSFDCALSPKENEGSMNKIEWEMKAGDSVKDLTQNKKHPVEWLMADELGLN